MHSPLVSHRLSLAIAGAYMWLWATPSAAPPGAQQNLVEHSVLLTVLDDDDRPIRDLTTTDFLIREGDATYEVSSVSPPAEPLDVALLIDTTSYTQRAEDPTRDLRTALAAFVDVVRADNPASRIAVFEMAGSAVMTVPFDADAEALDERVRRVFPASGAAAVVLEALMEAAREIGRSHTTRRALVVVDFDSLEHSDVLPSRVAESVQQSGAALWSVSIRRRGTPSPAREVVLNRVPPLTGGTRLTATAASGLESMLRTVAEALTSQYVVTYRAPAGAPQQQFQVGARGAAKILMSLMSRIR